jgi:hypothetical protein
MSSVRSAAALFLILMAAYAATVGLDATPGQRLSSPEAHQLLTAESIVSDHDFDLRNQYLDKDWTKFHSKPLKPTAGLTKGRLHEPQGLGFPLLIAPAYAIGGVTGVELFLAAFMALAFTLAAILGRRLVPDPWAWRAALIFGLSAPALGAATAIAPEGVGAALLAAGALMALHVRDEPLPKWSVSCALLIASTPWLSAKLLAPTIVIGLALARWLRNRGRGTSGFVALEIILTSAIVYVTVNDGLFGGYIPLEAALPGHGGPTGADGVLAHAGRVDRLIGLWFDRDAGMFLWAPLMALSFAGVWALWRSRRDRLRLLVSDRIHVEVAGTFYVMIAATIVVVAAFLGPNLRGPWFPGHELVPALPFGAALAAWGLRRFPKTGAGLAVVTIIASLWLLIAARLDGAAALQPPRGDLPWGGVQRILLPTFTDGGPGKAILIVVVTLAVVAGLVYEWLGWRKVRD